MLRFYYGWFVVAAAMLTNMLLIGITYSSFGLFVIPVSQEFGLSRADMNMALVLVQAGTALTAPLMGRMLDRLPIRPILVGCAIGVGLCLAFIGMTSSLWVVMALLLLPYPLFLHGAGIQSMNVLLVRWFRLQRGRAVTLATLGMSFGSLFVPPVLGALIEGWGWRTALLMAGGGAVVLLVPLFLLIRVQPGPDDIESAAPVPMANLPQDEPAPGQRYGIISILRMPVFWTISASVGFSVAVVSTMLASLVPLAVGKGLSTIEAATLISGMAMGGLTVKLLVAAIGDRFERNVLLAGLFVLTGAVCGCLIFAQSYWALLGTAIALGISSPITPVFYALLADRFGRESFGTAMGIMFLTNAIVGAGGFRLAGEIFDRTGSYDLMLVIFGIGELVAAAILILGRNHDRKLEARKRAARA